MAFHEHHVPTAAKDLDSRAAPLRRSSSLGDLLKSGPAKRAAAASRPHSRAAGVLAIQTADGSVGGLDEAERPKGAVYSDAGVSRCCVMEVDALNCSNISLQVWLGRRVEPKPASAAWAGVADSPRPWDVRSQGGGRRMHTCAAIA